MFDALNIQNYGQYYVVREDLFEGGTKKRALMAWLPSLNATQFSYTGSVFGYGAYALALACHELGYKSYIFIGKNTYEPKWAQHINDIAHMTWCAPSSLAQLQMQAKASFPSAYFLEAGFTYTAFESALVDVFKTHTPMGKRVWTSAVSGTVARAMSIAWPDKEIHVVCCAKNHGVLPDNVTTYHAPEKYHKAAKILPPYPSAIHTDAKIWQFVEQYGQKGDVVWNLAA